MVLASINLYSQVFMKEEKEHIETGCLVLGVIVVLFWFFVGAIIYAAF